MRHHVTVSQLAIDAPDKQVAPYMNVVAEDYVALGVITHNWGNKVYLCRDKRGFIGFFVFPTTEAFNEYMAKHGGWEWQEVEALKPCV